MVAAKAADADRLVADPPRASTFFLVYGPDTGLVAERVTALATRRRDPADPFSLIRIEGGEISTNPARLADEAYAVSMFGGQRAIIVRDGGGRSNIVPALTQLLKSPPPETTVVVEAGDLKKSSPLRTLFEKDRNAYAIACYVDDDASIGRLVDQEVKAAGLTLAPDARTLLVSLLGGDRLASRGEVTKLCLYAHGRGRIEIADVEAVTGDAASVTLDEIVDATALGDLDALSIALGRAAAEGIRADVLAGVVLRHFQMLDLARVDVDGGAKPAAVVATIRPPVFFKRADRIARMLSLWTAPRLVRALDILSKAMRDSRLDADLADEILANALFTLARAARR
ncbi:DNA polymerase III subunit delta [Methylobrevis pamukkalensis]|uniref:DNA-directed DNA polymerase n=1 Tax=Methylobrevis pamukkalensis TaxID=1439726 RepID=A0A1E3H706_9HYPH|nr:DNA polymerase III subunit delta [Methylobrevis pamukkalensis]ODN72118.1 DNA polymerase III subunit delta [Methylobrevis pamukkalensis]